MNYDPYLLTDLEFYQLYLKHESERVKYLIDKKKSNAPEIRYNFIEFVGFTGFNDESKLSIIKLVRQHTALSLKESKDLIDGVSSMFNTKHILSSEYTTTWLNEIKKTFSIVLHRN